MAKSETFAADTSSRTLREWIVALITLTCGLTIAHLGVTLFLISETGTDTFTLFVQGLARLTGVRIGVVHMILLTLITVGLFFFTKGYVKPGTIVCAFLGGPIIDLFLWLFGTGVSDASLAVRIPVMVAGLLILSLGMSIVIASEAGTGANDLVAIVLTDKLKRFQFRYVRMGCDVFFVAVGFALGGTVGIGTVAAILLTGPTVQLCLRFSRKLVAKVYAAFGGR